MYICLYEFVYHIYNTTTTSYGPFNIQTGVPIRDPIKQLCKLKMDSDYTRYVMGYDDNGLFDPTRVPQKHNDRKKK